MAERIGVLGGTFNPIHTGHLLIAQSALEAHDLARVLFMPCSSPPHKHAPSLAASEHRRAMIELAIGSDARFEFCNLELERGGISYAIDTVRELHTLHADGELCFIIGSDSLRELHLWKDIDTLSRLCRFITVLRPGHQLDGFESSTPALPTPWATRLLHDVVRGQQMDVSSSDIRHRIAEGMSIRYLVPDAVEMYIAEHGLYRAA
jgi:nicotinate-nucleotide adenylyltransferase